MLVLVDMADKGIGKRIESQEGEVISDKKSLEKAVGLRGHERPRDITQQGKAREGQRCQTVAG